MFMFLSSTTFTHIFVVAPVTESVTFIFVIPCVFPVIIPNVCTVAIVSSSTVYVKFPSFEFLSTNTFMSSSMSNNNGFIAFDSFIPIVIHFSG